jgi:hypothetical protein
MRAAIIVMIGLNSIGCAGATTGVDPRNDLERSDSQTVVDGSRQDGSQQDAGSRKDAFSYPDIDTTLDRGADRAAAADQGADLSRPDLMAIDTTPSPSCRVDETRYKGRCYSAPGVSPMTYSEAKALCVQRGATIATIRDAAEDGIAYGVLPATSSGAFIGLIRQSGVFVWEDGSALSYKNWAPGEPNNEDGKEHCVVIWGPNLKNAALHGFWNDVPCDSPPRDSVICVRTP